MSGTLEREADDAMAALTDWYQRLDLDRQAYPDFEGTLDRLCRAHEALAKASLHLAGELHCERCGADYPVWFAPSYLWNLVLDGPEADDDPGGMLCLNCFGLLAETRGIRPTAWMLMPEGDTPEVDEEVNGRITEEREACACIADHWAAFYKKPVGPQVAMARTAEKIAKAIRARAPAPVREER